jgi:PIN domain nuclease of toxin-antitoxin system
LNLLLDTNVLLWSLVKSPRLSAKNCKLIAETTLVYASAASAWEIAIKRALGKLACPEDLEGILRDSKFIPLTITIAHAVAAGRLPRHHDDPFDRMIVAQAQAESLTLVTSDARLEAYDIRVILA